MEDKGCNTVSAIIRSRLSNVSCRLVVGGGGIDSTVYEFSTFIYLFSEKIVCLRLFFSKKKKRKIKFTNGEALHLVSEFLLVDVYTNVLIAEVP